MRIFGAPFFVENASTTGRDGEMGVDNGERNAVSIKIYKFILLFYRPCVNDQSQISVILFYCS